MATPLDSPALKHRSHLYPPSWYGKVPRRVRMATTVTPDLSRFIPTDPRLRATAGDEFNCWVNSHGAVAVITEAGHLGVKPYEFEVIEWHEPAAIEGGA